MLEPIENQYFLAGHVAQSHGVDGTVLIVPEPKMGTRTLFDNLELVHLQNTRGDLIPARIESVRVQHKNKRLSFFVKFEQITDRNQAEAVKNYPVFIAKDKMQNLSEKNSSSSLISYKVMNKNQKQIGEVSALLDNPAHPILSVETDDELFLIPFVDEYIKSVDEENEIIYCKNLHQLIELSNDAH